jgi:hypothetical protein
VRVVDPVFISLLLVAGIAGGCGLQKNDSARHSAPEEERIKDAETCQSGRFPHFPVLC